MTRSPATARSLAVGAALMAILTLADGGPTTAAAVPCPVTVPTRTTPSDGGFGPRAFNYGTGRLRVHLGWPRGVLPAGLLPGGGSYAVVNDDGSIGLKLGWWRGLPHRLVITGRRLDRSAPPLEAHVPGEGYGRTGFVPSGLTFPTVGCWRVHGRLGPARVTFVVRVRKLEWR